MLVDQFVETLRVDGERLAGAAERAGLDASVPTCPGWRVTDLVRHVGGVHRWAAAHVVQQRKKPFEPDDERVFFAAPDDDGLLDWFRDGHRALTVALGAADPGLDCWTFLPAGSPLEFWARRQAHETAIHRADAEAATGARPLWRPEFAANGVDEILNCFFQRRPERLAADPPLSVSLRATDIEQSWTLRMEKDRLYVDAGHRPAGLNLTGTVSMLYLLLWNRAGTEDLTVDGDPEIWESWRGRATITWT